MGSAAQGFGTIQQLNSLVIGLFPQTLRLAPLRALSTVDD